MDQTPAVTETRLNGRTPPTDGHSSFRLTKLVYHTRPEDYEPDYTPPSSVWSKATEAWNALKTLRVPCLSIGTLIWLFAGTGP
jgi:hypothetical protein